MVTTVGTDVERDTCERQVYMGFMRRRILSNTLTGRPAGKNRLNFAPLIESLSRGVSKITQKKCGPTFSYVNVVLGARKKRRREKGGAIRICSQEGHSRGEVSVCSFSMKDANQGVPPPWLPRSDVVLAMTESEWRF